MKERVEFDAHKVVNKATKVAFRTKSGERLSLLQRSRPRCLFDSADWKDRTSCVHKAQQAR